MDPVTNRFLDEDEIERWDAEGFIVLRGLMSRAHAEAMRHDIDQVLDIIGRASSIIHYNGQYLRESAVDAYVNSPNLLLIANQLHREPSSLLTNGLLVKDPGGGRVGFHQDDFYVETRNGGFVNIWIALTESGPDSGGLSVCPGSHKDGRRRYVKSDGPDSGSAFPNLVVADEPDNCVALSCEVGDAVAFSNFTAHGSGPNPTTKSRYSYTTLFIRHGTSVCFGKGKWHDALAHPYCNPGPQEKIDPSSF